MRFKNIHKTMENINKAIKYHTLNYKDILMVHIQIENIL